MIYLVTKDWQNTSSNHAGMKHLCRCLERDWPGRYRCLATPEEVYRPISPQGMSLPQRIVRKLLRPLELHLYRRRLAGAMRGELDVLKPGDTVVLMEYLDPNVAQIALARLIARKHPGVKIYGMSHFVPSKIDFFFTPRAVRAWARPLHGVLTLGGSLSRHLVKLGVPQNKVHTLFHYLDGYYMAGEPEPHYRPRVIAMGNQMRDMAMLRRVVDCCPDTDFVICQGMDDLRDLFPQHNVTLVPFVAEQELRALMAGCDISLNCMVDTVGSNVIVTSIGMGLAMVCSDVGSVREYCDGGFTLYASSPEGFAAHLHRLETDRDMLASMRRAAACKGPEFSIGRFEKVLGQALAK